MAVADDASAPGDPSPAYGGPDEVVFVRDLASGHVTWSPAIEKVFGYSPVDVAPTLAWLRERVHPDDAERVLRGIRAADDGDRAVVLEYRFRRADGSYARCVGQGYVLNDAGGAPALAIGSIRDVSLAGLEYVRLLRAVAAAANEAASTDVAFRAAVDEVCTVMRFPVGHVFVPAADGTRLDSTAIWHLADGARYQEFADATAWIAFAAGTGLPGRVLAERRPVFIPDIAGVSVPRGAAALHAGLRAAFGCPVMLGDEVVAVLEFFSPEALIADAELLEVMADVGKQLGRVVERERAQRATMHRALHDPLTDLPNRSLLDDRLGQAIVHARRDEGSVALLFIDLDDFKQINDTYGHQAGDAVLREVASRLRTGLREQDTVARLGGDEFAVVLPETGRDGAAEAASRVRQALEPPFLVEGQRCHVGATVGIALFPLHAANGPELLRRADIALYEAKSAGIDFSTYEPGADK